VFILGITGGTGAGKTSALLALTYFGAHIIDCDEVYHKLLSEDDKLKSELENEFRGVLKCGEIDRRHLGEIVFNNPKSLERLNAITHKYVDIEINRQLAAWEKQGGTLAAIDAIALIESGLSNKCDVTIAISAPRDARISRIISRDGITLKRAEMRVDAQKPDAFYIEHSDYVLENKYDTSKEFEEVCKSFFKKILSHSIEGV